jgi:uncharacterized protein (DUF2062 family)
MRKFFRKLVPHRDTVNKHRWLRPFRGWLHHPNLWHLHRRSVAGGIAIGLFCGLIPGPFQMIGAALLAVLLRVNLPLAMLTTFYTNPVTIVPLYLVAYEIGTWVIGVRDGGTAVSPALPEFHWGNWLNEMWAWVETLGQPLLVGLPLLALGLAFGGYLVVRVAWYAAVVYKWRKRHKVSPSHRPGSGM